MSKEGAFNPARTINPGLIERRQITITVSRIMYDRLGEMAKEAGLSRTAYAERLFEAAYTARCKETGDLQLDRMCAAVALLWAKDWNTAEIGLALKVDETTVLRMLETFRRMRDGADA
ncbi:hypothetical protein IMF23_00140 [Chelatococcus daeguensis]|uniref:Ribbon-helix-helix protein, copG family n=1 Tax=Chelatococcus sambhunathii TaxID=363953 RepID=A0ABM9UHL5_9HYPH|nr:MULTISPECIES: hypothetical protein [Chelatococcus]KZE34126.1 hypothetical protein AVW15_17585 [Chelatococcus daeguensis]MBM3081838.1 hypothetical protein [Chelatococcus daeguensis]CUA90873.1 hypothetical protein Ga0061061_11626 [Chelatococcus sambhunathii]